VKILIAEDDLTSRIMLGATLRKSGHEVIETSNGSEALEQLQKPDAPSIAIIDWMMPVMDGLEVVRRIRSVLPSRPCYIILLTAKSDKTDIINGLNAGADDYISKPFDPGELFARLEVGRRLIEMQEKLAEKVDELKHTLDQIKTLRGIVPICMYCKKIRDDSGYWHEVEVYVHDHSNADFSHGLCLECKTRLFPGI
jgi:phosphoserine phosphatase RsbU/P